VLVNANAFSAVPAGRAILAVVDPLFPSGPVWVVVPDAFGSGATGELLALESAELEVELGAPVIVGRNPPAGANALVLEIDADQPVASLVRDGSWLRARGSSLDVCELALSLLRTMRRCSINELRWWPAGSLDDAVARVDEEVATTWPSFVRTGIDWSDVRAACEPISGVADMQRWVARLGDGHTNLHARSDVAALPYSAKVIEGRPVMVDVPEETVA